MSCPTVAGAMAAAAAAEFDTGAAADILVEGRPLVVKDVKENEEEEEETPMLTAAAADAVTATAAAPFSKDYRLDFTDVEGNLEEIPEEGTARMAAATGAEQQLEPVETLGGSKDGVGDAGAVAEGAEAAAAPAVAAPTAHFHIPESNASDYAYSECSFQVRYTPCFINH